MSATETLFTNRRRVLRVATATALVAGAVLISGGYAGHWSWTGLSANSTLWDWLELLLLPVVIATIKFWTTDRALETRHRLAVAAVAVGFAAFTACAYLLPIAWSGFVGNTLWDWGKLLFIPVLMPLVLVPAATDWINAGIADQTDDSDADEPSPASDTGAAALLTAR